MPRNELKHGSGTLGALGGKSCITVASIINDGGNQILHLLIHKASRKTQRRREIDEGGIMKRGRNEWVSLLNGSDLYFKKLGRGATF